MLFFVRARIELRGTSFDDIRPIMEQEIETVIAAKASGQILGLYKVAKQERLVGIVQAASQDELKQLFATLPMAPYLELEEILPVRDYETVAKQMKRRWQSSTRSHES